MSSLRLGTSILLVLVASHVLAIAPSSLVIGIRQRSGCVEYSLNETRVSLVEVEAGLKKHAILGLRDVVVIVYDADVSFEDVMTVLELVSRVGFERAHLQSMFTVLVGSNNVTRLLESSRVSAPTNRPPAQALTP